MRIIVGIDDSPGSRAALRYAMREAASHSAELVVVHAWEPPFETVYPTEATHTMRAAALRDTWQLIESMVAQAQAEVRRPVERIIARPMQGEAADVLTGMARENDLVVVGSNRRGLVRRLLLGSVSSRVVQESDAPVIVVPTAQRRQTKHTTHRRTTVRPGQSAMSAVRPGRASRSREGR